MKKKLLLALLLLISLTLVATFADPNRTLFGLVKGEAFFRWRPTSYWANVLRVDGASDNLSNATIQTFGRDQRAVPVIKECLEHPDRNVRWTAARLLSQCALFGQQVVAFRKLLDDVDTPVRFEAVIGLGNLGREALQALPQLEPLANTDDLRISIAARCALWNIDKATAIRAENWQDYENSELGFAARFPGVVRTDSRRLLNGESILHEHSVSLGSTHFTVAVTVLPPDTYAAIEERYDIAAAMVVEAFGAEVEQHNIALGPYLGREQKFTCGDRMILRSRIFIVGQHSYQSVVAYPPGLLHPKAGDYFLDSFQILPQ